MKSVTLGPTKTMIDMHNTNSCNLAWQFQTNRKTNSHTHKKPWISFDGICSSINGISLPLLVSLRRKKKLRLNKVAMEFEDCFRDPGLN